MGYRVTIDPKHLRHIEQLTVRQLKSAKNILQRSKRGAAEVNRAGLVGEFAVCEYFALDPTRYVTRNGSDGGVDLQIPGSTKTIQVKYRPQPGRDLIVANDQPIKADVVLLTENAGDEATVGMVGWVTREEFYRNATRRRFRADLPEDYMLPRNMLKPMQDIWGVL